jgi:orotidine-5'-phosphate decarboxylase
MERSELLARLREVPVRQRIITALDVPDAGTARNLAARLGPDGRFVKVGLELFSASGPQVIEELRVAGHDVFLDLKYYDIPNTVAGAARQAARHGATLVTIHAAAGRAALAAAAAAVDEATAATGSRPALLAVTVLTSLAAADFAELAPGADDVAAQVVRLASLSWDSGCDGVVCSPAELGAVRAALGPGPLIVTPGVRPPGCDRDDQRRVATPAAAMAAGADYLVIGRPVTRTADPAAALSEIVADLVRS